MSKTKKAYLRNPQQIEELERGKEVVLLFNNGEQYTGIFQSVDEEEIVLKSLKGEHTIGLPRKRLTKYLERFK